MRGVLTPASYARLWLVWLAIVAGVFLACMMVGTGSSAEGGLQVRFGWPGSEIVSIRLLRVLGAAVVGFALAGAGMTLQALLRNSLADPYVLGISTGSAVGVMVWLLISQAAFAELMGVPDWFWRRAVRCRRWRGALVGCLLVFVLARATRGAGSAGGGGEIEPVTMLLVGVVVSAMNAALLLVLNAMSPRGVRAELATYLLGAISENDLSFGLLWVAAGLLVASFVPMLLSAAALNIGTFSTVEATSLGINVGRLRGLSFLCASVMTAAALMLSGPIGFVGLICPHVCRRIVGADHRRLLVAAPLCGAAFLMVADTMVRVAIVLNRGQFPVGVVTALCGGPFFLWLLRRERGAGVGGVP